MLLLKGYHWVSTSSRRSNTILSAHCIIKHGWATWKQSGLEYTSNSSEAAINVTLLYLLMFFLEKHLLIFGQEALRLDYPFYPFARSLVDCF